MLLAAFGNRWCNAKGYSRRSLAKMLLGLYWAWGQTVASPGHELKAFYSAITR